MKLHLILNGRSVETEIRPDETLMTLLRDMDCKSVKCACDTTSCGCCTVFLGGDPVLSCGVPAARAEGKEVRTLEGLQEEARVFAEFMADQGADQCGYCNPGFVMNVLAMRRELKDPTEEEIKSYLAGNLCRCTGFASQHRAIQAYLLAMKSKEAAQ